MPPDLTMDAVLFVMLVCAGLLLISSIAGILAFYLGLLPVLILGLGLGLPLYGLLCLLCAVSRTTWDGRRLVTIVVELTQCAVPLYLGGALIAHQVPSAFTLHANAAAQSFGAMPIVQLCLGCSCLLGCAATGIGGVVAGNAFVEGLVRHLVTEG
jgi:hypothetical protein